VTGEGLRRDPPSAWCFSHHSPEPGNARCPARRRDRAAGRLRGSVSIGDQLGPPFRHGTSTWIGPQSVSRDTSCLREGCRRRPDSGPKRADPMDAGAVTTTAPRTNGMISAVMARIFAFGSCAVAGSDRYRARRRWTVTSRAELRTNYGPRRPNSAHLNGQPWTPATSGSCSATVEAQSGGQEP